MFMQFLFCISSSFLSSSAPPLLLFLFILCVIRCSSRTVAILDNSFELVSERIREDVRMRSARTKGQKEWKQRKYERTSFCLAECSRSFVLIISSICCWLTDYLFVVVDNSSCLFFVVILTNDLSINFVSFSNDATSSFFFSRFVVYM